MSDQQYILKVLIDGLTSKLSIKIGNKHRPVDVAAFCSNILKLLRSDAYQTNISKSPFIISLDIDSYGTGSNIFSTNLLIDFFTKGHSKINNRINIDINGNEIPDGISNGILCSIEELNEAFPNSSLIFLFIEGNAIDAVKDCITFKCIPNIFSLKQTRAYRNLLPISEYRTLISNHFNTEIVGQRGFTYWNNKASRLLVPRPEVNFRKRLGAYLDLYIADGIVDQECLNASTEDKNDIRVTTLVDNNMYILEVKWLGKCSSKTNYDGKAAHSRANSGINQLEIYIREESRCIQGILVIYDARTNNEEIIWNPDKTKWHKVIDKEPFILYLDSVSASVKAGSTVT